MRRALVGRDHIVSRVGLERCGDADAVGGLIVLEESGHDARQGESGTVERVAELYLLVGRAPIAAVEAIGLELTSSQRFWASE